MQIRTSEIVALILLLSANPAWGDSERTNANKPTLATEAVTESVNAAHTHPIPRPNTPTPLSDDENARALTPLAAYQELVAGNARFVEGKMTHKNSDGARRRELAAAQKPNAIILSCSDSRTSPEIVFDQGLGDIFPVRVAGNVLGAAEVASIEYAVEHLGTKLIVVMGHERCGAIQAALTAPKNGTAGSLDLDSLVASIQSNLGEKFAGKPGRTIASEDPTLRKPVMANVDAVSEGLLKRSHIVSKYVSDGTVRIVRGIYSLETGKVEFWSTGWTQSKP